MLFGLTEQDIIRFRENKKENEVVYLGVIIDDQTTYRMLASSVSREDAEIQFYEWVDRHQDEWAQLIGFSLFDLDSFVPKRF